MSVQSASRNIFTRTIFSPRSGVRISAAAEFSPLWTITQVISRASRNVHNSARLPTITASEAHRRPTLRPHHQPVAQSNVNGPSTGNKRTIFIQTETTPNPDVSCPDISPLIQGSTRCLANWYRIWNCRLSSSSQTTECSLRISRPHS